MFSASLQLVGVRGCSDSKWMCGRLVNAVVLRRTVSCLGSDPSSVAAMVCVRALGASAYLVFL